MLRAPGDPRLLIKGQQASFSSRVLSKAPERAEAAPLPMTRWILGLTPCTLQPGRSM